MESDLAEYVTFWLESHSSHTSSMIRANEGRGGGEGLTTMNSVKSPSLPPPTSLHIYRGSEGEKRGTLYPYVSDTDTGPFLKIDM